MRMLKKILRGTVAVTLAFGMLGAGVSYAWTYNGDKISPTDIYTSTFTDDTYFGTRGMCVDSFGNTHIVWFDYKDGNAEIYYSRLGPAGNVLIDSRRVTNDPSVSNFPAVAADADGNAHIVWQDSRSGGWDIYYEKIAADPAVTMPIVNDLRLTTDPYIQSLPTIGIDAAGNAHIAWMDYRDESNTYANIYYKKISGAVPPQELVGDKQVIVANYWQQLPSIAVQPDGTCHLVWQDSRSYYYWDVYYQKLDSVGDKQLGTDLLLTGADHQLYTSVAVDTSGNAHVVWINSITNSDIYYQKIGPAGTTLLASPRLISDAVNTQSTPNIAVDAAGNAHIVYQSYQDGNWNIYYEEISSDHTQIPPLVDENRVTNNSATQTIPYVGVDASDNVHIAWTDWRDGHKEIYYSGGVDTTPPSSVAANINNDAIYTTSNTVTIYYSALDSESGLEYVGISNSEGSYTWYSLATYPTSRTWTLENIQGTREVFVVFRDKALNVSAPVSDKIIFDNLPPSGTVQINSGDTYTNNGAVALTLNASDQGTQPSGISMMRFSNNNVSWDAWVPYSASASWSLQNVFGGSSANGNRYVYAQFKDMAGNVSSVVWDLIFYDNVKPLGSITLNSGNPTYTNSRNITLILSYSDANPASGVSQMRFDEGADGSWEQDWIAVATSFPWTLTAGDGLKVVKTQYIDNAGNEGWLSPSIEDSIILDETTPEASILINGGDIYTISRNVTLTMSASDLTSSIVQWRVRDSANSWPAWNSGTPPASLSFTINAGNGVRTVELQVKDGAGNITTVSDTIIRDSVAPVLTYFRINNNDSATNEVAVSSGTTLGITATDANPLTSAQMRFGLSFSDMLSATWEPYSSTRDGWLLPGDTDGTKLTFAQVMDEAGNTSVLIITEGVTYDRIILDRVDPTSEVTTNGVFNSNTWPDVVSGTFADPGSVSQRAGVKEVLIRIQREDGLYWTGSTWGSATWLTAANPSPYTLSGTWNYPLLDTDMPTGPMIYTVESTSRDWAENIQPMVATNTYIFDNTSPSVTINMAGAYSDNTWVMQGSPTIVSSITGEASGVPGIGLDKVQVKIYCYVGPTLYGWNGVNFNNTYANVDAVPFFIAKDWGGITVSGTWEYYDPDLTAAKFMAKPSGTAFTVFARVSDNSTPTPKIADTSRAFIFDYNDPSAGFSAPVGGSTYKGELTFTGTASDESELDYWTITDSFEGTATEIMRKSTIVENDELGKYNSIDLSDGTHSFKLRVVDSGGNFKEAWVHNVKIDNLAPVTTPVINGTKIGDWYTSAVSFTLEATDLVSGVQTRYYRINGTDPAPYSVYTPGNPAVSVPDEGYNKIDYYSTDNNGNTEVVKYFEVLKDIAAPTSSILLSGTVGENGWYTSSVIVQLQATDATSGLSKIYYRIDDAATQEYTSQFTLSNSGQFTVYYWAVDAAGNVEAVEPQLVKIDKEVPTTVQVVPPANAFGWYTDPVVATLETSDPLPSSGIVSTSFEVYFNYALMSSGTLMGASPTLTLGTGSYGYGDGRYDVNYRSKDNAGNLQNWQTFLVRIDQNGPSAPAILMPSETDFRTKDVDFILSGTCPPIDTAAILVNDSTSGVALNQVDGTWNKPITIGPTDGAYTFNVKARDAAGNTSVQDSLTITLDRTGPSITMVEPTSPTKYTVATLEGTTQSSTDMVWIEVNGGSAVLANLVGTNWTKTVDLASNSDNIVYAYSEDTVGNTSPFPITKHIYADQELPLLPSIDPIITPTTEADLKIEGGYSSADTAQIMLRIYFNTVDPGTMVTSLCAASAFRWSQNFHFAANGTYYIHAFAIDSAGNISSSYGSAEVVYDTTKPPVNAESLLINGGAAYARSLTASLELTSVDQLSGTVTVRLRNAPSTSWISYAYDTVGKPWNPWVLSGSVYEDGLRTVEAQFIDSAGNESDIVSASTIYDSHMPEIGEVIVGGINMLDEGNFKINPGINPRTIEPTPSVEVSATDNYTDFLHPSNTDRVAVDFVSGGTVVSLAYIGVSGSNLQFGATDPIPAGDYTLRVTVTDLADNATVANITGITIVGGDPQVTSKVIPVPNPFNPPLDGIDPNVTTKIYFTISADPDKIIGIYILDTSGRLVVKETKRAEDIMNNQGYDWVGYTQYNEIAENGVYLVRIVDETNKKLIGKTKVVIIKKAK